MNWFTTKLIFVSVILYLMPSGECRRRYHNIQKRWSFDQIVTYFDGRHGTGARSFMVYQGDWWWLNPLFSLFYHTRMIKGYVSHIQIPIFIYPYWIYRYNKLLPFDDYYHFPMQVYTHWIDKDGVLNRVVTLKSRYLKGSFNLVTDMRTTPDFRIPEHVITWKTRPYANHYVVPFDHFEYHRYFRLQGCTVADWVTRMTFAHFGLYSHLARHIKYTNCYCVLVYKRHTPFAMGAVLSFRSILTTASATEMLLQKYRRRLSLINLLGLWYSSDVYSSYCYFSYRISNNSYYATPARIVYHDLWIPPKFLNRTHPLPVMHDLALWTTTSRLLYMYGLAPPADGWGGKAQICHRFSYAKYVYGYGFVYKQAYPPNKFFDDNPIYIISAAMVTEQGRIPFPWFRYQYLTNVFDLYKKCPMIQWGWFYCLNMRGPVARMGVEPGAAFHVAWHASNWWGLAGMATLSIRLRTKRVMTMFTILDTHVVLTWLYDAFKGRVKLQFLDIRFRNRPNKHLDFIGGAMAKETYPKLEKAEALLHPWWPSWPISSRDERNSPWFWYWHYKSLPMERDFFYDIMTF